MVANFSSTLACKMLAIRLVLSLFGCHCIAAALLPPSQDPFYKVPQNLSSSPGTILNLRPTPAKIRNIGSNVPVNITASYQILYRTTDSLGLPTAAVATLLIPFNAKKDQLLAYPVFYDAVNVDCASSYVMQQGSAGAPALEQVLVSASLNRGWNVIVPDSEGPHAAFAAGVLTAQVTLDAIRAALSVGDRLSNYGPQSRVALMGYSGGGLTVSWAAALQPTYAPELSSNIVGAAYGGLFPNLTSAFLLLNESPHTGFAAAGLIGVAREYPELQAYMDQHLLPSKKAALYDIASGCIDKVFDFGKQDLFSYFDTGVELLSSSVAQSTIGSAGMLALQGTPTIPMYIHSSANEDFAPIADTDHLVDEYCKAGANVQYEKNLVGAHVTEGVVGQPGAFAWVADRLNGLPAKKGCHRSYKLLLDLSPEDTASFGQLLVSLLKSYLGLGLGPWQLIRAQM